MSAFPTDRKIIRLEVGDVVAIDYRGPLDGLPLERIERASRLLYAAIIKAGVPVRLVQIGPVGNLDKPAPLGIARQTDEALA